MLYFPQLDSGASVQYPFVKQRIGRTVINRSGDGHEIKLLDPGATMEAWELTFTSLSNVERTRLEEFFSTTEGRLGSFTLLDPTQNLLLWSEDLAAPVWTADPQLSVAGGFDDPAGGTVATRLTNGGAASQSIVQSIEAPSWYRYCFSVYAKGNATGRLTLFRSSGIQEHAMEFVITPAWTRLVLTAANPGDAESVAFGIRLEAGSSAYVYGPQAEAQPAPSAYRKTTSRSGVCAGARFNDDFLAVTSDGPEQHACTVHIVVPAAG